MDISVSNRDDPNYPAELKAMHKPPSPLYYQGNLTEIMQRPRVAIVGSRLISPYGRQVTRQLAEQLAGQGIVIVSGLALGVDAQAHAAALSVGGLTLAVLPSPVEAVAPATNRRLAKQILAGGGAVVSAYPEGGPNHKGNFVERNEIVAAISNVVVVTEAGRKSGSRHTAQFAADLGVPVFAVPGNINSPMSVGTNNLIKASMAAVATSANDILRELGLSVPVTRHPTGDTPSEQCILDILARGSADGDSLLARSGLPVTTFNQSLTMLEITAKIVPLGGNVWGLG